MSSEPSPPSIIALYAYPIARPVPTVRFLSVSWWTCWTTPQQSYTWRTRSDSLLATDEPVSIMLRSLRDRLDVVWTPEVPPSGMEPQWRGIPCRMGRVPLWLPLQGNEPLRELSLLVLVPEHDPVDGLPYVLLGTQFLLEHRSTAHLDCSEQPGGHLQIP